MTHELTGKRILITAGAAGIGRIMAEKMNAAGARVFVCDIDQTALADLSTTHPDIGQMQADISDRAAVDAFFEQGLAALGGLDVLVNNAGIAGPTGPVEDINPDDFERTLAINITGQFLCTRLAVPHLKAAGGGAIINLSSAAGKFAFPLRTPYSASKWAVVGFTKSLAAELGPFNIRVNAILPGAVEGPRIERVITAKADARGVPFEEMLANYTNLASMGRLIPPEDIAAMALFLASDDCGTLSGQALSIDGDTQMLK
ncbi:MAG: 3-oxoacyl-[acyl-carrier-protein] reductase [Rhodospirillaceae bacterium]|jgi:NAD(P)-dependent dehydrogenase (short-subunit alcohol dehydrogenase family)|uniref:SDR family oxidoreductase n=1 Tax=Hwanghaeella sp. 1Z406 TaxID=3402811 RepID=UPI000C4E6795|nr:3-oxoacyl-[acyl-carrier-protein] reductase [Rhodospirillales bacterium]MAX47411.1 3-oxoacyl-[acyl-carrier-protein] reductase [Rhodospirillaceae bacterium]|tara:strand:- start:39620 stop:40396 length:777 start_codon:yes stop_codon:yes gene_type:complete